MTTHTAPTTLAGMNTTQLKWLQRLGLIIIFFTGEAAFFIFGSYYFDVFSTNKNLSYNLVVSAVFLAAALGFKFHPRLSKYWLVAFAFFIASVPIPVSALLEGLNRAVAGWFGVSVDTSMGMAVEKTCEVLVKTVPILVLVKLSGADFGSVYLKRGNMKLGLGVGWLMFFFLAPASFMFAVERFTSTEALIAAVVWGLVFSIGNAFMEELWLRGILLKRFIPFIGDHGAVWVTALVFAWGHSFAFYFMPMALPFFFVNTLALGLGCGYLMVKSDSIWGPVIIHAASDFYLFLAVLASV